MLTISAGPTWNTDAYLRSTKSQSIRRTDFSEGFHTFGLEWSEDYIIIWRDNKLQQVLFWSFDPKHLMWQRGEFSQLVEDGKLLANPWAESHHHSAPFDQDFYMILNVAVGSRTGWFPNQMGNKPWVDGTDTAMQDFWNAVDQWYPTWGKGNDRGMTVKNIKMWQQKGYNGC